jgi:hypothetical protein
VSCSAAQVVIASVIEDRIQRRYYMVPFSARIKRPQGVLASWFLDGNMTLDGNITASTCGSSHARDGSFSQPAKRASAWCRMLAGTPEGIGKADYLSTLINQITSGLGATVGLAQMIARAMNVRARRLEALHDVSVLQDTFMCSLQDNFVCSDADHANRKPVTSIASSTLAPACIGVHPRAGPAGQRHSGMGFLQNFCRC